MARVKVATVLVVLATGAAPLAAEIPPPPPIIIAEPPPHAGPGASPQRGLLMWMPGQVRCAQGAMPAGAVLRRPYNSLVYSPPAAVHNVTLNFEVDDGGRLHSIARAETSRGYGGDDIAPALASSSFPPGPALSGCSVTYSASFAPLAQAPLAELVSYSMNQHSGVLPREGWQRIEGGADCFEEPRPKPLLRAFPDFRDIPATPGIRDWSLTTFDTDEEGRPVNVTVRTGTGNQDLDRAAIAAISESRFTGGARTGCLYPYWRAPAVLAAPPMPAQPDEPEACNRKDGWAIAPALTYPPAYRRRAIEGWAVVRYDVAPWGATGNVEVLAAQPSEDFGNQAKLMLARAKAKESERGVQGCVVHVRFAMSKEASQDPETPPDESY